MTGQFETRKKRFSLSNFFFFYIQEFLQKQLVFSVYQKREKKQNKGYNGVYARCDVTKIMATKSATFSTPIGILEEFIRKTRLNAEL